MEGLEHNYSAQKIALNVALLGVFGGIAFLVALGYAAMRVLGRATKKAAPVATARADKPMAGMSVHGFFENAKPVARN